MQMEIYRVKYLPNKNYFGKNNEEFEMGVNAPIQQIPTRFKSQYLESPLILATTCNWNKKLRCFVCKCIVDSKDTNAFIHKRWLKVGEELQDITNLK